MAVAVDGTYTGMLAELVIRPAVARPALSSYFTIVEGVKGKQIVTFLERTRLITIVDPGCGTGITTVNLAKTTFTWDPVDMKAWVSECWKDLRGKVEEHYLKAGNDKKDLSDTVYGDFMVDALEDGVGNDLLRMAWFADSAMVAGALTPTVTINGTVYTSAQLLLFFKTFKGAWKRIFDGVAATTIKRVAIAQNGSGTNQIFAEADAPLLFKAMFNGQPAKLAAQPNAEKQFLVSRSIFNAWTDYRESRNLDLSFQVMANGESTPTYRGVPVLVVDEWDAGIATFFQPSAQAALAGKADLPNRAILTVKGNMQLGFDATPINDGGRATLEVWTSMDTEKWNARATYTADQQIADHELIVVAY